MYLAQYLIFAAKAWVLAGGLVACGFLLFGVDRIDPGGRRSYVFRPLLIPGVVLLWPLVLMLWVAREKGPR